MSSNDTPQFMQEVLKAYKPGVAHAFILHFNVNDYTSPTILLPVSEYLARFMQAGSRDLVVRYSIDQGITFFNDEMKELAFSELGLTSNESEEQDATLAALYLADGESESSQDLPSDPSSALPILDKLLRLDLEVAVIVEGAELLAPPASFDTMQPQDRLSLGMIRRWGNDPDLLKNGNTVFLLTSNIANLHPDLLSASYRFLSVEVPLPNQKDRLQFVSRWVETRIEKTGQSLDLELNFEEIANATAGLSLLHIEDILLRARVEGKLTSALIWERKRDIIRSEYGDVLEIIEPGATFADIGGLSHVKDFFRRSVINPIKKGNFQRVPMGVLLTGPAGTGKSIMAEAIATEASINVVRLNVGGNIASKWQGEGERNLVKALQGIEGVSPSIVFMDEIDQSISRGGEGGGNQQDSRIFQKLLEFMSDTSHRGQVVFLAATNRPDLMDAALRRPGRFDKKVPFVIPDAQERVDLFQIFGRKYLDFWSGDVEITEDSSFVIKTEGQTGAEIEAIAVKARELVEDYEISTIEALEQAAEKLTPSTADIEFMTMLAIQECNDSDLLPPRYQEMMKNKDKVQEKIRKEKKERGEFEGRGLKERSL